MELSLISPSSSSNPPDCKYEVFLSFNGEDTRNNFTSHLHRALCDKKIETFIDYEPRRGDDISPSFLTAIEESQIAIIVFSKGYASSRWCLEELVKIIQCRKIYGQIMIPVFYEIDPSDVRHQKGSFEDAFVGHEQRFKGSSDRVQRWKDALKEAADLSGLDSRVNKPESVLIEKIVQDVLKRLNDMPSGDNSDLIGIDSRIREIELLLNTGSKDVRSVGIWGIGGIGKTTLAEAVFNKISFQFEGSYFTWSVREASEQSCGLNSLRRDLFSTILGGNIGSSFVGRTFTRKRLGRKKLLIVFDDVTSLEQIESLIGGFDCLGSQSRIIVTSRDKQVLKNCKVDQIYEAVELYYQDALKLFCRDAFGQNRPTTDFEELSEKVVEYVGGVPLALKVLGSSLFGKNREFWESAMNKLENIYDKDIHEVLKISYEGLDDDQQSIFLDIACFFKGWDVNLVKAFMDACGFFTETGISALIDKSLVTISRNKLTMHDLLEAMGKEIVREESIDSPGKRSRLWHHNDIFNILTNDTGSETIEGISLDMSETRDMHLNSGAFVKMKNLRLLKFFVSRYTRNYNNNKVHVPGDLEYFSSQLCYLHWHGCPLKSLQSTFHLRNLVILDIRNSNVEKLWSGFLQLDNLKEMNLSESPYLTTCPDLSGTANLRSLMLMGCTSLVEISSSIQQLDKLESFYPCGCTKLKMLPELPNNIQQLNLSDIPIEELPLSILDLHRLHLLNLSGCSRLKSLPSSVCKWKSLKQLFLSNCPKLDKFPDDIGTLPLLTHLWAEEIAIKKVPSSISCLKGLSYLSFSRCKGEDGMGLLLSPLLGLLDLKVLDLSDCGIPEIPDNLGCLTSLEHLYLQGNNFQSVPVSIINLSNLEYLKISNCKRLKFLPELPLTRIEAHNCSSLELLPCLSFRRDISSVFYKTGITVEFVNCFELDKNLLKDVVEAILLELQRLATSVKKMYFDQVVPENRQQPESVSLCYPETMIPKWFMFQSRGSSINLELPPDWFNYNFGFALSAVVAFPDHQCDLHVDDDSSDDFWVHYECNVKFKDGDRKVSSGILLNAPLSGPDRIRSNHVIVGFHFHFFDDPCSNELSFKFYVEDHEECCKVEKCGVHLISVQHLEASAENGEGDEPHPKRLKQIENQQGRNSTNQVEYHKERGETSGSFNFDDENDILDSN